MVFERALEGRDGLQQRVVLGHGVEQVFLPFHIHVPAAVSVRDPGSQDHCGYGDGVSDEVIVSVNHDAWEPHVHYLRPAGVKMLLVLPPFFVHRDAASELGGDDGFQADDARLRAQVLNGDFGHVAHVSFEDGEINKVFVRRALL